MIHRFIKKTVAAITLTTCLLTWTAQTAGAQSARQPETSPKEARPTETSSTLPPQEERLPDFQRRSSPPGELPSFEKMPDKPAPEYKKIDEPKAEEKKSDAPLPVEKAENKETKTMQAAVQSGDTGDNTFKYSSWTKNNSTINLPLPENDAVQGSMNYRYPIFTPPGRNGMEPGIQLSYSSANNQDSEWGYSWSISIPSIERINKTGSNNLYSSNFFNSSLSGELVKTGEVTYGAKEENGTFLSYTFANNIWIVKDKKGTTYTFGNTAGSRQDNPVNTAQVYKWMLEEIRDTNDNFVRYEYFKDAGQIYPSKIFYTGHGSQDGIFEVDFTHTQRNDIVTSYKPTFAVTRNFLINEIETKINGSWIKKYTLQYITGRNGKRSLLDSITETSRDTQGAIASLPPTQFQYGNLKDTPISEGSPIWEGKETWNGNGGPWETPVGLRYEGVIVADVNSDGLIDFLQNTTIQAQPKRNAYIHTATGWKSDPTWLPPLDMPFYNEYSSGDYGVRAVDINGDGRTDLIRSNSEIGKKVYLNTGSGWKEDTDTWINFNSAIQFSGGNQPYRDIGGRILDINGDGLPDLIMAAANTWDGKIETTAQLNTGSGWIDTNWKSPVSFVDGATPIELNGDGLVDLITYKVEMGKDVAKGAYINTGSGWIEAPQFTPPIKFIENKENLGVRPIDINGDGLSDLVQSTTEFKKLFINNGSGWSEITDPYNKWLNFNSGMFTAYSNHSDGGTESIDINGDGTTDLFQATRDPTSGTLITTPLLNKSGSADVMQKITYPTGGKSIIEYKSTNQYLDANGDLANKKLPTIFDTVWKMSTDDGFGNTSTKTFSYEGGTYYFGSPFDKKLAGFQKVTEINSKGNKIINFYHQGNENDTANGEFSDHISKLGKSYKTQIFDDQNKLFLESIKKWERVDLTPEATNDNKRNFIKLTAKTDLTYDGSISHQDKAETYSYDDSNGNMTEATEWGEVSGKTDGSFTDTGSDKKTTIITYAQAPDGKISDQTSETTQKDASGKIFSQIQVYYDNKPLGTRTKGNITSEKKFLNTSSAFIGRSNTYNDFGLTTSTTDANGNTMNISYDSSNLYPMEVTDPKGFTQQFIYDFGTGKVREQTDENGIKTIQTLDGFGRTKTISKNENLTEEYIYNDTSIPKSVTHITHFTNAMKGKDITYFDGFGKTIQKKTDTQINNAFATIQFTYNGENELIKQTFPFFTYNISYFDSYDAAPATTFTYDALGRMTAATTPTGTTTTNYTGLKKIVTDALGHSKKYTTDTFGQLTQTTEILSGIEYNTNYSYDPAGNLTRITDPKGNIRNFTYDSLGRRTSSEDLHTPTDTTFSKWTFTYDNNGNLITEKNASGKTRTFTYDSLNRTLTEDDSNTTSIDIISTYDTAPLGKKRLAVVTRTSPDGTGIEHTTKSSYEYDALGNVTKKSTGIDDKNFTSFATYNTLGQKTSETENGIKTIFTYTATGLLDSLDRAHNDGKGGFGPNINIITKKTYNAAGQVLTEKASDGTFSTYTYDAVGQLTKKKTIDAFGKALQDLAYTFDAVGNITQIVENAQTTLARTVAYAYDDLYRLTSVTITTGGKTETRTYAYDILGNILTKPSVGTYTYAGTDFANPHAVTSILDASGKTETFSYDDNGNLTKDGSRTLIWNSRNELLQATKIDPQTGKVISTTNFFYDHSGNRVIKKTIFASGDTNTITYINGSYEIEQNSGSSDPTQNNTIHRNYLSDGNKVALTIEKRDGITEKPISTQTVTTILNDTFDDAGSIAKYKVLSGAWNYNAAAKAYTSTKEGQSGVMATSTAESSPSPDSYYAFSFTLNLPTGIAKSSGRAAGMFFMVRDPGKTLGGQSYALIQYEDKLMLYKSSVIASGATVMQTKWTLAQSIGTTKTFNYKVFVTPGNGLIQIFRDGVLLGSYTDPAPWKGQRGIILLNRGLTDATFDNILTTFTKTVTTTPPATSLTHTYHTHTDHLGSSSIITQGLGINGQSVVSQTVAGVKTLGTGEVSEELDSYPFGEERITTKNATFDTPRKFTGKETDEELGLIYFGARYYDSRIGRFISLDPLQEKVDELIKSFGKIPQAQNSYSYAANNPIILIDPNGEKVTLMARGLDAPIPFAAGVHTFLRIEPNNPNDFYGIKMFTIGAYDGKNGNLEAKINQWMDKETESEDSIFRGSITIETPKGKTDTEFINDILGAYSEYGNNREYAMSGVDTPDDNTANCNNFTSYLLDASGANMQNVRRFDPIGANPGLGKSFKNIQKNVNRESWKAELYILSGRYFSDRMLPKIQEIRKSPFGTAKNIIEKIKK